MWKFTDTTRKLYHIDKTTTPNATVMEIYSYYNPQPTCLSIKEDTRRENLERIKKIKERQRAFKLWKK